MTNKTRIWAILSGIISFALGIFLISKPVFSLLTLVLILGGFLITSGIFLIIDAIKLPKEFDIRSSFIFEGIMLIIIGLFFALGNSAISIATLSSLLLFWFILTSILQIQTAWTFKQNWVSILSIVLNVLVIGLSIYSMFDPLLASSILAWTISVEFIISGINKILVAFLA